MFDKDALERALYKRLYKIKGNDTHTHTHSKTNNRTDQLSLPFRLNEPRLESTDISFESSKTYLESTGKFTCVISSSTSLSWVVGMPNKAEVFVNGRKQGAPKGKPTNEKTRPSICKKSLLVEFKNTRQQDEQTYYELKKAQSVQYQETKACLLDQVFDTWVQTPKEYEEFL